MLLTSATFIQLIMVFVLPPLDVVLIVIALMKDWDDKYKDPKHSETIMFVDDLTKQVLFGSVYNYYYAYQCMIMYSTNFIYYAQMNWLIFR